MKAEIKEKQEENINISDKKTINESEITTDADKQIVSIDINDKDIAAVVPIEQENDNSDNEMDSGFNSRYILYKFY